ncbi:type III secretion system export apparatus subunit SctT [Pseudomonas typographi]|uniref:SpaR/YscT/HrcT type III secretion system export apparatus protein n=1 Tax=Pseudomonas typographi TaxID=2715964 RepID=A0ABR7Z2B7_9PSED|nr:type III secretion system export apparatus subunit SctT [Pseudomonas typographi]MBD1552390.1 SpaR/YscT/HrcT type III secretion system export apparatus protein [Pseudomonas typographi]MBD1587214.1 SpaR/YscT/HrcT type III secretion system export apparatus protein [Pseudomonas typographi]MBD1599528.1 SpaR/YscT/HrcT type III secretion system export apparatus protein [Pseudomonas typographi]
MNVSLFFDLHAWLAGALLCMARLAPVFFMLPFLNGGVLTGAPRTVVIMLVGMALWPYTGADLPALNSLGYLLAVLREGAVGLAIACLLGWPFWVMHAVGNLIDNQRGAMLSNTVDPANGNDTSELANFLQLMAAALYLQGGGMLLVLETLAHSYRLCTPDEGCDFQLSAVIDMLDALVVKTILVSAPVVAMLLLSEALLGLLARFAPQMNAFSVSLTIKSAIAFVVLLLYLGAYIPEEVLRMGQRAWALPQWLAGPEGD